MGAYGPTLVQLPGLPWPTSKARGQTVQLSVNVTFSGYDHRLASLCEVVFATTAISGA